MVKEAPSLARQTCETRHLMSSDVVAYHQPNDPRRTRRRNVWLAMTVVLLGAGGVIAIAQAPPHAATFITESCCPKTVHTETSNSLWRIQLAVAAATTACCWVAGFMVARKKMGPAVVVALLATSLAAISIGDFLLVMRLGSQMTFSISAVIIVGLGAVLTTFLYFTGRNNDARSGDRAQPQDEPTA